MSKKNGLWDIYERMAASPQQLMPSTPISGKGGSDSVLRTPDSGDAEGSDIRERRRHLSAAERRKRAKYRKTASFKKAQRRYSKKTSRAGYRPNKAASKASRKAARYRKRY